MSNHKEEDSVLNTGGPTESNSQDKNKALNKVYVFDVCFFALCFVFMLVMWATGWNFFPLIAIALAAVASVLILIRVLLNKGISLFLWLSYLLTVVGTLLFFLGWSAESIGKRFWWNIALTVCPIGLAVAIKLIRGNTKSAKIVSACIAFLMTGTALVYALFMSMRLTPTVDRMWEGQEDYLKTLKEQGADEDSPNVLFILMDDMAYSDLSCYSYMGSENATINTPNIDSIADGGIYMENFYASAPVCTPSRFSALTGRYAMRGYIDNVIFPTTTESTPYSTTHFLNPYQFLNNVDGILGDEITVAEALDALGYDTSCIGKWNLGDYGEYLPTNQGFDYFYGSYYVNDMTPYNWVEERDGIGTEIRSHADNLDQSESTKLFTDKVLETISSSVENENKFFNFYTTPWPHYPIYSDNNGNGKGDKTDDSYVECIEEFDTELGRILDYMKNTPDPSGNGSVYDNTLVIFTSDNGPGREGVTGALRGRKNTTFDGGMKVPMLVSYPNGNLGKGSAVSSTSYAICNDDGTVKKYARTKKIESSAMLTDLFPTIMDYVTGSSNSMPTDRVIDGVSLVDLFSGNKEKNFRVHDVLYYMKKGSVQAVQMSVELDGTVYDFKYYENVLTENSAFIDQRYNNYLFNLDTDPAEGYNLSMTYPDVADSLHQKLEEFRNELKENRRGKK